MKIPQVLEFLPFSAAAVILRSAREIASAQESLKTTQSEDFDFATQSIELELLCCDSDDFSRYKRVIMRKYSELIADEAVRIISLQKINKRLERRQNEQTRSA
jgi:hypothetical protein